jgi:MtN3 and saliva related transmembrane protein
MELSQFVGITAGVLTSAAMLPQLVKLVREKKSEDVSLLMLTSLLAGIALWIWYGIMKKDAPIIYTNCFSFLVNALTLIFSIKYKEET